MDKPIQVLHVIGGGEFGGAEQHIISLLNGLRSNNIMANVVTFYDSVFAKTLRELGFSVTVIPTSGRFDIFIHKKLADLFCELNPDIIHTHGVRANFFSRMALRKDPKANLVTTIHSFLRHDYPNPIAYAIAKWMEKSTQSIPKQYITVSQALKDECIQNGISPEKITVVHNGIDLSSFQPTDEIKQEGVKLREALQIEEDAFVFGATGRLVSVKGLPYLIRGFAQALQTQSNLHLLIVGDGPEKESLRQLTETLHIHNHVHFLGFRSDINVCLSAMDAYLNVSLSEGFSLSLVEAMAMELPVIATKVGGMKEIIEDEVTGLFISPQSENEIEVAILRIINDVELRVRIRKNARETVLQKYSIEKMCSSIMNVYLHMVERR